MVIRVYTALDEVCLFCCKYHSKFVL